MALLFSNNASGTLANTLNDVDTTAVLDSGQGALFPSPTGGDTFYASVEDSAGNLEIISCTARSADTLTITRAQEGTVAQTFTAGARLELRITAATLATLVQSADATGTFAPTTHFNANGLSAEQLHNSSVVSASSNNGVNIRRRAGSSATIIGLQDEAGAAEASVESLDTGGLVVENAQVSGTVTVRGNDSSATPTDLITMDPNGAVSLGYDGSTKALTAEHGVQVRGTNPSAPYSSYIRLYDSDGAEYIAALGMVDSVNELRVASFARGFPVGLYGADTADGTLRAIALGSPDGGFAGYYAGVKKYEATSPGMTVTGVVTQTTAPTAASHLTTKSYVDDALAASYTGSNVSATSNGYLELPNNVLQQWGYAPRTSTTTSVVFPTGFSAAWNVVFTPVNNVVLSESPALVTLTNTGFTYASGTAVDGVYYQAIGSNA